MSYTAQLFESLLRASNEAAPPLAGARSPQLQQPQAQAQAQQSSGHGVGWRGSPHGSLAGSGGAELVLHGGGGGGDSALPNELDECYAVIRFQRSQAAQLRGRIATLEEQNTIVRAEWRRAGSLSSLRSDRARPVPPLPRSLRARSRRRIASPRHAAPSLPAPSPFRSLRSCATP